MTTVTGERVNILFSFCFPIFMNRFCFVFEPLVLFLIWNEYSCFKLILVHVAMSWQKSVVNSGFILSQSSMQCLFCNKTICVVARWWYRVFFLLSLICNISEKQLLLYFLAHTKFFDNSEMVPSHLQLRKFKQELNLANEKIGSLTTQLDMNVSSSMCLKFGIWANITTALKYFGFAYELRFEFKKLCASVLFCYVFFFALFWICFLTIRDN